MREIDLREYAPSPPLVLSVDERAALARKDLGLGIAPVDGTADKYTLTPGSVVGAVEAGGLSVYIEPKISIGRLLSLACYAIGKVELQEREFSFPEDSALPDALARAFGAAARRAFSRGLLHGYRTEEDALPAVRGRIRFRRPDPSQVRHPTAGRGALRRVHGRHSPEPPGKGGRSPSWQAGAAFAGSAQRRRLGCGIDGRRVARGLSAWRRAGGQVRPPGTSTIAAWRRSRASSCGTARSRPIAARSAHPAS